MVKDPEVADPIRFLRAREVVHFQRFGEALRSVQDELNSKNFYAFNPSFDAKTFCAAPQPGAGQGYPQTGAPQPAQPRYQAPQYHFNPGSIHTGDTQNIVIPSFLSRKDNNDDNA